MTLGGIMVRYFFLVGLLCLSSARAETKVASKPGTAMGNGSGYGGGEHPNLTSARKSLVRALRWLRDGFEPDSLAHFTSCHAVQDPGLCNQVLSLSGEQKEFIRRFVALARDEIIRLNTDSKPTPFQIITEEMEVPGPDGKPIEVAGETELGPKGPVKITSQAVSSATALGLLALIAHEFGHKAKAGELVKDYIEDNKEVGPFKGPSGGRHFLDAMGAAIAIYISDHVAVVPLTFPDPAVPCVAEDVKASFASARYFSAPSQEELNKDFEAGGQRVDAATDYLNKISHSDFTIAIWAKIDGEAAAEEGDDSGRLLLSSFNHRDRYYGGVELARLPNGNFGAYVATGKYFDSTVKFTPDVFHHLVLRRKDKLIRFFVDGKGAKQEIASYEGTVGNLRSYVHAYLARAANPPMSFWKGNIAGVALYNKALSDDTLQKLYQCGANQ